MFYLYNPACRARLLARELGVRAVIPYESRIVGSRRRASLSRPVNWGCTRGVPEEALNANVCISISKVETFAALDAAGVPHPQLLTREEAGSCGSSYLGRRDLLSGGRGITIYEAGEEPTQRHDFFTRLISCRREWRAHVFNGEIIGIQKKRLAEASSPIHNHENGVLFQHIPLEDFNIGTLTTASFREMVISAIRAVGLDFGAVDILQENDTNNLYVLETNSAPGIVSEPTFAAYLRAFETLRIGV